MKRKTELIEAFLYHGKYVTAREECASSQNCFRNQQHLQSAEQSVQEDFLSRGTEKREMV